MYNLHVRVDALIKSLEYYDIHDVFRILPEGAAKDLDQCLETLFVYQSTDRDALRDVSLNPTDKDLVAEAIISSREVQVVERGVGAMYRTPINIMSRLQDLDESTIRQLNHHYTQYMSTMTVENLAWRSNRILTSCEDSLCNKVRKGLVGVLPLESG